MKFQNEKLIEEDFSIELDSKQFLYSFFASALFLCKHTNKHLIFVVVVVVSHTL